MERNIEKAVLSGNEAVARGAWEAGVHVAVAYPGTPSTEITATISTYPEVHANWCTNEKVALEVAAGAAIGGARALCCMKHVGVNVAADPLFSLSYMGVNAGLVLITADEPGCTPARTNKTIAISREPPKCRCWNPPTARKPGRWFMRLSI